MFEKKQKKRKYRNKINSYINFHLDRLDIEFAAFQGELMPEEALTSFTVSDDLSLVCGSGIVTEV